MPKWKGCTKCVMAIQKCVFSGGRGRLHGGEGKQVGAFDGQFLGREVGEQFSQFYDFSKDRL